MHTADARLFESCGEAAGAATVEADYVDAPCGGELRGVQAHGLAYRNCFGHEPCRLRSSLSVFCFGCEDANMSPQPGLGVITSIQSGAESAGLRSVLNRERVVL